MEVKQIWTYQSLVYQILKLFNSMTITFESFWPQSDISVCCCRHVEPMTF
jgi:hypothetical protein